MKPFWREQPLNADEIELLDAVFAAHHKSSFRENVSSHCFVQTAIASGSYPNAVAAAALTIGGLHAPIEKTISVLKSDIEEVGSAIGSGRIAGWGNSFEKGHPDALWTDVDQILFKKFPDIYKPIQAITDLLHSKGKMIYPNPSTYTAATVIVLQMPDWMGSYLFLAGRLSGWTEQLIKS